MVEGPLADRRQARPERVVDQVRLVADETGPVYRQGNAKNESGIDTAVALALVERVMPDAFMGVEVERALGIPTILLSEKGEFIRTGRTRSSDPRGTR